MATVLVKRILFYEVLSIHWVHLLVTFADYFDLIWLRRCSVTAIALGPPAVLVRKQLAKSAG